MTVAFDNGGARVIQAPALAAAGPLFGGQHEPV